MKFQIGDKIVCIKKLHNFTRYTVGNIYEVCEVAGLAYLNIGIKDDLNISVIPSWDQFVSIKEYRKLKLEKINEKINY